MRNTLQLTFQASALKERCVRDQALGAAWESAAMFSVLCHVLASQRNILSDMPLRTWGGAWALRTLQLHGPHALGFLGIRTQLRRSRWRSSLQRPISAVCKADSRSVNKPAEPEDVTGNHVLPKKSQ